MSPLKNKNCYDSDILEGYIIAQATRWSSQYDKDKIESLLRGYQDLRNLMAELQGDKEGPT